MKRIEQTIRIDNDTRDVPRRAVYFHESTWPCRSDEDNGYLFRPSDRWDSIHFSDRYRRDSEDQFRVPRELLLAFEAGESIEPVLDWLIENYADTHPWLPEAVARVCGQGVATQ